MGLMESKYLSIVFIEKSKSEKTNIYLVTTRDGLQLGMISWHGHWRQYVFFPDEHTLWSSECLDNISLFLKELNKK